MVLLKNDGILPLKKKGKVAFVGAFRQNSLVSRGEEVPI